MQSHRRLTRPLRLWPIPVTQRRNLILENFGALVKHTLLAEWCARNCENSEGANFFEQRAGNATEIQCRKGRKRKRQSLKRVNKESVAVVRQS